jgi:hypothetical protein
LSATRRFSWPFSFSSSFSRLASSAFIPPYWLRQRCKVCSETSRAFAASPIVFPSESICSAIRSLRMICSGLCLCLFTCFGPPLPIVVGGKDSQTGRTDFRGSGHLFSDLVLEDQGEETGSEVAALER